MMLVIYILLQFSLLVTSQKSKVIIGLFIGDETLPFGIHRAGPAIELGIKRLNETVGDKLDVEVIRHISGSECVPELIGIFATAAARMYHEGKINAIIGPIFIITSDSVALRNLMLMAHSMGMTDGDYVFLYFYAFHGFVTGDIAWNKNDENDENVKKAYESLLVVSLYKSSSRKYKEFEVKLKNESLEFYNYTYKEREDINPHVMAFYNSFLLYGEALKETIEDGDDYRDSTQINKRIWNRTFEGINGQLHIDAKGDLDVYMTLLDLDPDTGDFIIVGSGTATFFQFTNSNVIHWPNNRGPPANSPPCGFLGDAPECFNSEGNTVKRTSILRLKGLSDCVSILDKEELRIAYYKGTKVSLSKSKRKHFTTNRRVFMELLQLRDVNCHNLAKFIGLTESDSGVFIVTEFCSRGELRDILSNESFKLNVEFCISLICDIIQAMEYIHSSSIRFHGHLNSQNCVIDSRFVLKVTDYGIRSIRDFDIDDCREECLWLAPEMLRKHSLKREIWEMQSADIYSFGIILYEILSRKEPFEDDKDFLTLEEILEKLKDFDETPFRPRLDMVEIDKDMEMLMKRCWDEDPKARPTFAAIRKDSRRLHWNKSGDKLLDTLLSRMEEYADNLEGLVEERTQNLIEEKMRSEELLYQVLPRSVAIELKSGRVVDPEAFACVTIYFSDIVGFTQLSSESTPMQVVDLLNDLYTCFDRIIDNYDVYKVETIGDAYMVVSGLPQRNGDQHSIEIARMALSVLESVKNFKIRHRPDMPLRARIGIHSGPVCAGVVGRKMPRYCLFGDTVNTASRMESNGDAMKIHISESTRNLLYRNPEFFLEDRGELQIKGKGIMKTYWLIPPTSQPGII
ncbi:atrial natriuretic peptide receptor 2-like [Saccostrea echinata]|uniref:atrial natriuretic peptide receptor 2-like n=1 Tax=Saccostrea echinata TaxID=191078 RepID=UPI002A83CDEF|nr:atrial natriuretic peptide receptor 2-like [Saccostrea echinata]